MNRIPDESPLQDLAARLAREEQANADLQTALTNEALHRTEQQTPDSASHSLKPPTITASSTPFLQPISVTQHASRYLFSVWQVILLVVVALLIGGITGTLFVSFNLRVKNVSGTAITIPVIPTATSSRNAGSVQFIAFSNSNFSIIYPSGWKQTQSSNTFSFSRSDVITRFTISIHNQDKGPQAVLSDLADSTPSCTIETNQASIVTINNITWQQSVWDCFLAGALYTVHVLIHPNGQQPDQTAIVYAGYQQVGSSTMVNFAQANTQYFQPMLQSFQLK